MNFALTSLVVLLGVIYSKIKENNWITISFVGLLCILIALRSIAVPDTDQYTLFFESLEAGNLANLVFFSYEPGFQLYSHLIKLIVGNNSTIYLLVIVLTNVLLLRIAINKISSNWSDDKPNYLLALMLYFAYYGLFYNAIVLRAGIAISFLILANTFLIKENMSRKEKITFISLIFLALVFHYSSLVGIVGLLIFKYFPKFTLRSYLIVWMICVLFFFSGISIYFIKFITNYILAFFKLFTATNLEKYEYYLTELYNIAYILPFKYIFSLFSGLFFLLISTTNTPNIYYKFLNVFFAGLLLGAIFSAIDQFARISDYFLVYSFILYWYNFKYISNKWILGILFGVVFIQLVFVFRIINV